MGFWLLHQANLSITTFVQFLQISLLHQNFQTVLNIMKMLPKNASYSRTPSLTA